MASARKRRPPPDPTTPPEAKEPWGSHRYRERLYREIDRRLAALKAKRDAAQQKAPGLSTGGSAGSADEAED